MMNELRDKLEALLEQAEDIGTGILTQPGATYLDAMLAEADHLIANGVTIQRWIPVEEQLPKTIPCDAGTAYSEVVNVLTAGRKVLTAVWDGEDFIADTEFWEAEGETITHWTPVLLPLPDLQKEME